MNVQEIMTKNVRSVAPSDPVKKAAEIMESVDCGSVPVTDQGRVVGMLTDRDIVIKAVARNQGPDAKVEQCMTTQVVTVKPSTDAREAADIMAENQVRRLPVVDQGALTGILAIADLARVHIYVSESGAALSQISKPNRQSNSVSPH